jgi:hypothetical protein
LKGISENLELREPIYSLCRNGRLKFGVDRSGFWIRFKTLDVKTFFCGDVRRYDAGGKLFLGSILVR